IEAYLKQSSQILKQKQYVAEAQIMDEADIQKLVAPWLGEDTNLSDIPLPGLIAVSFQPGMEIDITVLEKELQAVSPFIRIDTHQSWLSDVLRFAGALQFGSILLLSIIGVITFSAVAGAIKSRIAVHKDEVELLHLIGATDQYITSQFQKHTAWMTLQSAAIGTVIGLIALFIVGQIAGRMDFALLPDFTLSALHQISFLTLPVLIAGLAMLTARITVLHALRQMP
ncbi:MAG: FtsX-like permease family protein, partial [Pseudomonadota bacterium]